LTPYLIKNHARKAKEVVEVKFHEFLTSGLEGDERMASRPGCITPWESDHAHNFMVLLLTHWY